MHDFFYYTSPVIPSPDCDKVSPAQTAEVLHFHRTMDGYAPTPLVDRASLAKQLGVAQLWVKDESHRFGLNAFKGLGGSYAIAKHLAGVLGVPLSELTFAQLSSAETRAKTGTITFVTATDGNHGRGVAWAAQQLGHRAVVYMPKGTAQERLDNILALGAEASITDLNYDDAVRKASHMADTHNWVLIQDTAWEGYEDVPVHIMQGYTTLAAEVAEQLGDAVPTHLFLQAGVGSFAGAALGYFSALWGDNAPITTIMEPTQADCIYRSAKADDGNIHFVTGEMNSMMAGLCCGEPCTCSWSILRDCATAYVSCDDAYSARGMRLLGQPTEADCAIVSGESGAVGAGVLEAIMMEPRLSPLRDALKLTAQSRVLLVSTEGDTDRNNYQKILSAEG